MQRRPKAGRTPPAGSRQLLVAELLNIGGPGTNKHSEYYVKGEINFAAKPSYVVTSTPASVGTERRFYVIQATDSQWAAIQAEMATHTAHFTLSLYGVIQVSPAYPNTRG